MHVFNVFFSKSKKNIDFSRFSLVAHVLSNTAGRDRDWLGCFYASCCDFFTDL